MILNMGGGGVVPKVNYDATTITPGTEDQIIPSGTYLRGDMTILGDSNLTPENIVEGVDIFGVQGTGESNMGVNVWSVYDEWVPTKSGNVSFSLKNQTDLQVSSNVFSYEEINTSMFSGKMFARYDSTYVYVFKSGSTWALQSEESGYVINDGSYTYDKSTGVIKFVAPYGNVNWYGATFYTISATITAHKGNLIGYAVSNNSNKYPNGGTDNDGIYYEMLAQTASVNVMSLTNEALETVQGDYREQIETEVSGL